MNIYEIDEAIMNCINEDGEVIDLEAMERLQMERAEKIENVACWVKNLESDIAALYEEEKNLAARRKAAENKAESLRKYLAMALGGQKFSTPRVAISYRKSTQVSIPVPEKVPASWYKASYSVDKAAIKKALQNGEKVPGASLVENLNMQIK